MSRYVVAGSRPWARRAFNERLRTLPGEWTYIGSPQELTRARLEAIGPRFVFFLHWSWLVPAEIHERFECVNFHMTDLPYGRGGSPLQNLIARGHKETVLTAFRMERALDAGPVYVKEPMGLDGAADEIYERANLLAAQMIARIVRDEPTPEPQRGEPTLFRRRTPAESEIRGLNELPAIYDHIRMLDAEGYPRAFLVHDGFRYEFRRAIDRGDALEATVTIRRLEENP